MRKVQKKLDFFLPILVLNMNSIKKTLRDIFDLSTTQNIEYGGLIHEGKVDHVIKGIRSEVDVSKQMNLPHQYVFHTHPFNDNSLYNEFQPASPQDLAMFVREKQQQLILCQNVVWKFRYVGPTNITQIDMYRMMLIYSMALQLKYYEIIELGSEEPAIRRRNAVRFLLSTQSIIDRDICEKAGTERLLQTISNKYNINIENVVHYHNKLQKMIGTRLFKITAYKWN